MLGWFNRRRERKLLAPVAGAVPALLVQSFGPAEIYTAGQVRSVASRLKLTGLQVASALAACCSEKEFVADASSGDQHEYRRLRAQLAAAFDIDRPKFNCEHLLRLTNVPRSARWNPLESGHDHGGG